MNKKLEKSLLAVVGVAVGKGNRKKTTPGTAKIDEDGIVTIYDSNGHAVSWMDEDSYNALAEMGLENK